MRNESIPQVKVETYQVSKNGSHYCGDSYFIADTEDYFLCVVADGLGSGEYAMYAAVAVKEAAERFQNQEVEEIMAQCNNALKSTRGAAVSVLKIYKKKLQFIYSGVGNIRFYLYSPDGNLTYPIPVNGFLSGKPQSFKTGTFSYQPGSHFLIHTDGISISGIKNIFSRSRSLSDISSYMQMSIPPSNDDATYVLGCVGH